MWLFFHSFRWAHWYKVCYIATHTHRVKERESTIDISIYLPDAEKKNTLMKLPKFKGQMKVKMCVQSRSEVNVWIDIDVSKVLSTTTDACEIWLLQKSKLKNQFGTNLWHHMLLRIKKHSGWTRMKTKRRGSENLNKVVLHHMGCLFTKGEEHG